MEKAVGLLRRVGSIFKAPWRVTGPVSGKEYVDAVPEAHEYRPFAPANAPQRVYIPHAEPSKVYNIKYYERDTRRYPVAQQVEKLDPAKLTADELEKAELPPAPGRVYSMGPRHHIDEMPDGGYTR